MTPNILKYESDVWRTADLLIGAGIKQSDFPKYMMPFFALLMVESRLIREADEMVAEGMDREEVEDFVETFKIKELGYNDFIVRENKSLKDICKSDKTFDTDFDLYLKSFDAETRYLLGVERGTDEEKFLDISGISGQLKKKKILFNTVKAWSAIDLTPFNNSEITTLEEHIKRKWADISAETAGEQYTPDDIILLIAELIAVLFAKKESEIDGFLTIYDGTCGGGNLLFGVEDNLKKIFPDRPTATFGQEWNDTLYALAKIESRFRQDAQIEYGNTLTEIGKFYDKSFNIAVANPPYGVDWKGYEKDIKNDTTGRFHALPSISDGQFLFTQHFLHKIDTEGIAIVVHNGSTLFSGDAGSGESSIRKKFFEEDWVEAIVQMPTDEFFNTGIYTYLWIFNKNKPEDRKDKVALINASELFEPLKKSKGKKRRQMNTHNRAEIVQALVNYTDKPHCRIFDKWEFYYNKQSIMLLNLDDDGNTYQDQLPLKKSKFPPHDLYHVKANKYTPVKITQGDTELLGDEITTYDTTKYTSLKAYFEDGLKPIISALDYQTGDLSVTVYKGVTYTYDTEQNTILETQKGKTTKLGCGKILVKATYSKPTKTKPAAIKLKVELTADNQKDYEIIPYAPDEQQNARNIADFMEKYVTKPFEFLDNTVGVELNFNKVFYTPETLRSVPDIVADLADLEKDLADLEKDLAL